MALTPSTMLPLGTVAPGFSLPNANVPQWEGLASLPRVSLEQARGPSGLLVLFICNHCPYVKHIRKELAELTTAWMAQGLGVVGINSNDVDNYPDDSPAKMTEECRTWAYKFPYLFDENQQVAKAYQAACTPDIYLFDASLKLVYRGQFDDSRPGNGKPVTGRDLDAAVQALLSKKSIPLDQEPSIGCNIKWKAGHAP